MLANDAGDGERPGHPPGLIRAGRVSSPPMRRLARWVFSALCLLSLLSCGGTCAAWARSYCVCDVWQWRGPGGRTTWYASRGRLANVRWVLSGSSAPADAEFIAYGTVAPFDFSGLRPRVAAGGWEGAGFADWIGREWATTQRVRLIPLYPAPLLFAFPPLAWIALYLRRTEARHRQRLGLCIRCGYALTGNTSGRCSECGELIYVSGRVTT